MKKLILIPDIIKSSPDVEFSVFGPGVEIIYPCVNHSSEIDDDTWMKVDAILAWHELQYTEEVINKLNQCKVIARVGVGFDNVDLKASGKKGISVCNVPDYGTNDVADHTIALMLTLMRGILTYNEKVRISKSWNWGDGGQLHRLTGLTIGIIGLGKIGIATAFRAKSFGINVNYYDPYLPDGIDKALGFNRIENLSSLLQQSDVVSIHCPLTDETKGMAGPEFFSEMKKGAFFINTARGEIVELNALNNALRSNHIKAAGLDVLPEEPPDHNHSLIKAWRSGEQWISQRLIITPHAAFYNEESYLEMRQKAAEEVKRVLNGQKPKNCVNNKFIIN